VLVDAGFSMRETLTEKTRNAKLDVGTRFDAAKQAVQSILSQKMLFRKKDEVSVIMYGAEETLNELHQEGEEEYKHVQVLAHLDEVTLPLMEKVRNMQPASKITKTDMLDGIIVALDLIARRTEKKKYDKRLVIITDAATKMTNPSDIFDVVEMIKSMEVKVQTMLVIFDSLTIFCS